MFARLMFSVFFFKQKTAYEMRISDWSSDVCSSDLAAIAYTTKLRTELSDAFAKSLATVEIACYMPDRNLPIGRDLIKDHMEQTFRIRELINALYYDVCLRIC